MIGCKKCDWCQHSYIDHRGLLMCRYSSCQLTDARIKEILKLIKGN